MLQPNTKLIDKYNYELKLVSASELTDDYVVLVNTNQDGTDTNRKVKLDQLREFFRTQGIVDPTLEGRVDVLEHKQEASDTKIETVSQTVNQLQEQFASTLGTLEERLNKVEQENLALKESVNILKSLLLFEG